jgi:hypothetical protein
MSAISDSFDTTTDDYFLSLPANNVGSQLLAAIPLIGLLFSITVNQSLKSQLSQVSKPAHKIAIIQTMNGYNAANTAREIGMAILFTCVAVVSNPIFFIFTAMSLVTASIYLKAIQTNGRHIINLTTHGELLKEIKLR